MTLTVGQLVAYLSVQGVQEANRDVKEFQRGLSQAGDEAKTTGGKVEGTESALKGTGDEAVKTGGKLRETSGALVGAAASSSRLAATQAALDAATRKVTESTAKGVSANAAMTAAQARLTAAEERAAALRAAGNATAVQTTAADARVAAAKAAVATASTRVAEAAAAETLALQGQAAASAQSTAASAAGAAASGEAADSAVDVAEGATDASDSIKELAGDASVAGASILAAFGAAQVMFSNFDAQMSSTGAAVSDLADDDLQRLRQASLDAGASTFFSATQAAAGEEALLKAGTDVSDVIDGALVGSLNLAASGNLDVADSAETAATAMTVFGLSGADVPHIADVLAAAAGKAQGEVSDMSQALNQSALVANQAGLSFEDTAGALAMFASAGLQGSDAGTSFKTMLLALNPSSDAAAGLINDLGISAYDSQGKFIGLSKYAQLLHDKLLPLPDDQRQMAMQTIFGTDAIRASTIVMNAGAKGVDEWAAAVNDSGYAQEQAAAKMDNLKGDVEQLSGAFQTLILENSSGVNGFLRGLVGYVTDDVNALGQLPPIVGQVGSTLGVGVGAMALFGGASMLLKGRLDNMAFALMNVATGNVGSRMTSTMGGMSRSVSFLSNNIYKVAGVAAVGAIAFSMWASHQAKAKEKADQLRATLDAQTGALSTNTEAFVVAALQADGTLTAARDLGLNLETVTQAALGNKDAMNEVSAAYQQYVTDSSVAVGAGTENDDGNANLSSSWNKVRDAIGGTNEELNTQIQAAKDSAAAMGSNGQATAETAAKQDAATTSIDGATVAMRGQADVATILKNELDRLSGQAISEQQAQLSLNASMNSFTDAVKQNGASLIETRTVRDSAGNEFQVLTDGAQKNQSALIGAIDQVNKHAEAVYAQTSSVDAVTAALSADEAQLRAAAQAAGLNADEVNSLIAQYAAVPNDVVTNVKANIDPAHSNIAVIKAELELLSRSGYVVPVYVKRVNGVQVNSGTQRQMQAGFAEGGPIRGPGTPTSDSVPILSSDGEFMQKAAAVNKTGVRFQHAVNDGDLDTAAGILNARGYGAQAGGGGQIVQAPQLHQHFDLAAVTDPRDVAAYTMMRARTSGIV